MTKHLQQDGNLGVPVEPQLVVPQPPQDVSVAGDVVAGSRYVVESGAVAAPPAQTGAGRRAEVRRLQVAMTAPTEEHAVLQLGGVLGNLGGI